MNRLIAILTLLIVLPALGGDDTAKVLRVYPVTELAPRPHRFAWDDDDVLRPFALLGMTTSRGRSATGKIPQDLVDPSDVAGAIGELFTSLAEDSEIQLSRGGGHLLVRATPQQHQLFEKALAIIRGAAKAPLELEVRHLTIPAAAAGDPDLLAALDQATSGTLDAASLARLAGADRHQRARTIAVRAPLGEWTSIRAVRERRYLPEYDVEIAQASAIADPIPSTVAEGVQAMVRPFLLRSGRVLLRVVASAGDLDPELRRFDMQGREYNDELRLRNTDYGLSEQQADYRGCAVSTELLLDGGRTAVLVFSSPDPSEQPAYQVLLFTLKTAPEPAAADTLAVFSPGALTTEDPVFGLRWDSWGELLLIPIDQGWSRMSLDAVEAAIGSEEAEREEEGFLKNYPWLYGGSIVLRAKAEWAKKALGVLDDVERQFLHGVNLHIRLLAGGRPAGMVSAQMVAGRPVALAGYHKLDYVGDYEVEVAQESRIADPNHMVGTEGIFLNGIVLRTGPRAYRLRGNLKVAGIPTPLREIDPQTGGLPHLQALDRRVRTLWLTLDLAPGRPQTLTLGPNPFDPEGKAVLTAEVTLTER